MSKKSKPDPKKEDKAKLRLDANEIAHRVMLEATGQKAKTVPPSERDEDEKDPEAVERGKKGGEKGGEARAEKMSEAERKEAAEKAARARWSGDED